jgi:hypothetical protein
MDDKDKKTEAAKPEPSLADVLQFPTPEKTPKKEEETTDEVGIGECRLNPPQIISGYTVAIETDKEIATIVPDKESAFTAFPITSSEEGCWQCKVVKKSNAGQKSVQDDKYCGNCNCWSEIDPEELEAPEEVPEEVSVEEIREGLEADLQGKND